MDAFQKKFMSIQSNFLSSKARKRTIKIRKESKKKNTLEDYLENIIDITWEGLETFNKLSKEE